LKYHMSRRLTIESDLSIATKEALDVFLEDNDRKHSTVVQEIHAMSGKIANSVQAEISQQLPVSSDKLCQEIHMSRKSIETTVSQSSNAVSHSIKAEIDHRLPLLEESVVSSVTQQADELKSSMEAVVAASTAEMKYALDMYTKQQAEAFASMCHGIPGYPYSESAYLKSPLSTHQFARSRRLRKSGQHPCDVRLLGCTCSLDIGQTNLLPRFKWGIGKESERFVIHKRSCPLWYKSQVNTKWSIDFLLYRLRVFGSLSTTSSPHTSIFGCRISHNLTCRMTVADDAPAFKILEKYHYSPELRIGDDWTIRCIQELRAVFQSGRGSPYDTLTKGFTLIEVSTFSCFYHLFHGLPAKVIR
jgi:hypothetical protein